MVLPDLRAFLKITKSTPFDLGAPVWGQFGGGLGFLDAITGETRCHALNYKDFSLLDWSPWLG
jgi:hypothetical protein